MTDRELTEAERRVLNTLIAQTNEFQGEWTSERSLLTVCAANGRLTADETLTALVALTNNGHVEEDGEEYRPAEGVERVPHPGEVSKK
ncbi:hypothetical protein [Haloarcula sp. Atlit-120R]|uniref:hypothetical protein n=1 Tax=Haloarcula sp. Atlit-120R TaxID=2282135 RepID=UPI000EF1A170|nr:hypothetical protein [Haloarcula sp. Atlit-120R]RLM32634.1 hypothetical protein DVK01_20390 [Haloarcula sp. Atlit-120R]